MMAQPYGRPRRGGLDGDQVDPDMESRESLAVGQAVLEQSADGRAQVAALAVVERLLGEPEVAPAAPADLDDDQDRRRTRVDRHEIELMATDMDVPGQDGPARFAQSCGNELLSGVTRQLSSCPTGCGASTVHAVDDPTRPSPPGRPDLRGGSIADASAVAYSRRRP